MNHEILRACGITAERGGRQRLDHVDLLLLRGQTMGVLGRSGVGKHTLASVLAGEIEPSAGKLLLEEKPADRVAVMEAGTCIRPEDRLFAVLSVSENLFAVHRTRKLYYPAHKLYRLSRELLESYQLQSYVDAPIHTLSAAVQHRLLLVRAVVQRKKFVVLDHLAVQYTPQEQMALIRAIEQINAQDIAVLYTTDHQDIILDSLSKYMVMDRGRVVKLLERTEKHKTCAYLYGYQQAMGVLQYRAEGNRTLFSLDGNPIMMNGCYAIRDGNGSLQEMRAKILQICKKQGLVLAEIDQNAVYDSFVDEMSALDNLVLSAASKVSGGLFSVRKRMLRLLQQECMEYTGLTDAQLTNSPEQLSRIERLSLLIYRWKLRGARVYLFTCYDREDSALFETVVQQICGNGGAVLFAASKQETLPRCATSYMLWENGSFGEEHS